MVTVGIDFGTSFSCVALCNEGKVDIISNENDKRLTPSYVAFTEEERLFGDVAKYQAPLNLKNTLFGIKRLVGLTLDEYKNPQTLDWLKYDSVPGEPSNRLYIPVTHQTACQNICIEQATAMVLNKMKEIAENHVPAKVTGAMISVPASFNGSQRQTILDAGRIAGFEHVALINEPTAAAIAYGMDKEKKEQRNVLIYDFGGGTFDVSIVTITGRKFRVLATAGSLHFGGDDIDKNMAKHFLDKMKVGDEEMKDKKAIYRLIAACEKGKRTLSASLRTRISVDCLFNNKPFDATLNRDEFNEINKVLFSKTMSFVEGVLKQSNLKNSQINEIVLIGGSSRIPKIRELLADFFEGRNLSKIVNPDEAVAYGAAVHACANQIKGYEVQDISGRSIGCCHSSDGEKYACIELWKRSEKLPVKQALKTPKLKPMQDFEIYDGEEGNRNIAAQIKVNNNKAKQIGILFDIDENGVLKVRTSPEDDAGIISQGTRNLTEKDVVEMIAANEGFNKQDEKIRVDSEARNNLENYAYKMKQEISSQRYRDLISDSDRSFVIEECKKTLQWLDGYENASKEQCEGKMSALNKSYQPVSAILHEKEAAVIKHKKIYNGIRAKVPRFSGAEQVTLEKLLREVDEWMQNIRHVSAEEIKQKDSNLLAAYTLILKKRTLSMSIQSLKRKVEFEENDRNLLIQKCDETEKWLNGEDNITTEDCESKQKELEKFYNELNKNAWKAAAERLQNNFDIIFENVPHLSVKEKIKIEKLLGEVREWAKNISNASMADIKDKNCYLVEAYDLSVEKTKLAKYTGFIRKELSGFEGNDITYLNERCEETEKWLSENDNITVEECRGRRELLNKVYTNMSKEAKQSALKELQEGISIVKEKITELNEGERNRLNTVLDNISKWMDEHPNASIEDLIKARANLKETYHTCRIKSKLTNYIGFVGDKISELDEGDRELMKNECECVKAWLVGNVDAKVDDYRAKYVALKMKYFELNTKANKTQLMLLINSIKQEIQKLNAVDKKELNEQIEEAKALLCSKEAKAAECKAKREVLKKMYNEFCMKANKNIEGGNEKGLQSDKTNQRAQANGSERSPTLEVANEPTKSVIENTKQESERAENEKLKNSHKTDQPKQNTEKIAKTENKELESDHNKDQQNIVTECKEAIDKKPESDNKTDQQKAEAAKGESESVIKNEQQNTEARHGETKIEKAEIAPEANQQVSETNIGEIKIREEDSAREAKHQNAEAKLNPEKAPNEELANVSKEKGQNAEADVNPGKAPNVSKGKKQTTQTKPPEAKNGEQDCAPDPNQQNTEEKLKAEIVANKELGSTIQTDLQNIGAKPEEENKTDRENDPNTDQQGTEVETEKPKEVKPKSGSGTDQQTTMDSLEGWEMVMKEEVTSNESDSDRSQQQEAYKRLEDYGRTVLDALENPERIAKLSEQERLDLQESSKQILPWNEAYKDSTIGEINKKIDEMKTTYEHVLQKLRDDNEKPGALYAFENKHGNVQLRCSPDDTSKAPNENMKETKQTDGEVQEDPPKELTHKDNIGSQNVQNQKSKTTTAVAKYSSSDQVGMSSYETKGKPKKSGKSMTRSELWTDLSTYVKMIEGKLKLDYYTKTLDRKTINQITNACSETRSWLGKNKQAKSKQIKEEKKKLKKKCVFLEEPVEEETRL